MENNRIIELVNSGLTYKQVRKEIGCALSTVVYHCKKAGIESKHIVKKINEEKIKEIRDLYEKEKSSLKVAKILGISKTTVLKYVETIQRDKLSEDNLKSNRIKQVIYWRRKAKIKLAEYKGGKCEKCGYNKCIDALEFHHKDPKEKDFNISGKSWSFERLKKEVEKCILVCSNCHKEIHFELKIPR